MKSFCHAYPSLLSILFTGLFYLGAPGHGAVAKQQLFELRGKLILPYQVGRQTSPAVVFLQAASRPFSTSTLVNLDGSFKFKKLLPMVYRITIAVPEGGEMERTIEIGQSFADKGGRIERTFEFDPDYYASQSATVQASQLTIPEEAWKEYQKALKRLEKRDSQGASKHLNRAVKLAPGFAIAWNRLGTLAYMNQHFAEAEGFFRKSLECDPRSYSPLVNLGAALLAQGRLSEALEVNRRAVQARPNDPLAQSQLGQCYFIVGEMEKAEKRLLQAKTLDPAHFSYPQLVLAEIYRRRGDNTAVVRELEEFLVQHPDFQLNQRLSRVLETARKKQESP